MVQFRTEHEKPPSDATTAGQRAQLFSPFLPSLLLSLVPRSFFPSSACLFFFFFFPSRLCKDGRVSNEAKTWALAWHRGPFAAFPLQAGAERRARDA